MIMSKERIYWPFGLDISIAITDKALVHKIKDVCRLKDGEPVYLFDGKGGEYRYFIEKVKKDSMVITKDKCVNRPRPPKKKIYLGFPLTREERIDFILQKSVELGVSGFIPFICERSIRDAPSLNKIARWNKIIIEACRQSGRLWLPGMEETVKFNDLIKRLYACKIAGAIDGRVIKQDLTPATGEILVVVGPEGDFSHSEYEALTKHDFEFIKLASVILRVETAAVFAVGLINYFTMG